MNASELVAERARLLIRIEEINAALALLENPGRAVEIDCQRNLRNTYLGDIVVYDDNSLTKIASNSHHSGWVTAEDAARLRVEFAEDIKDGYIRISK